MIASAQTDRSSVLTDYHRQAQIQSLDKIVKAEGMITFNTKTDKDASASKRPKGIGDRINPPPSMFSSTTAGSSQATYDVGSSLLTAEMRNKEEERDENLAKMMARLELMTKHVMGAEPKGQAIKKAMQPSRDKLRGLCAKVQVLENDLIALREDVARHTDPIPSINMDLHEPAAMVTHSKPPKSPPDDWWVGFDSSPEIISNEEIYHSRPPTRWMLTMREVDPSWKPGGVDTTSYHELRTLPNKWVVPEPGKPLELPPDA
ncbi:hypothetical protein HAX54_037458 [Datura stramonium]|uniref:Uncharacterized protein n=1 Tax=Datura stramonium TaxID=4076 RepID=A0ABS8SH58_DATST|nr:hypothetical protein [Datura stramonium]